MKKSLLIINVTQWLGSKFSVYDPASGIGILNGGFSIGGNSCGANYVFTPNVGGAGYPIYGDWFTVGGITYFMIQ